MHCLRVPWVSRDVPLLSPTSAMEALKHEVEDSSFFALTRPAPSARPPSTYLNHTEALIELMDPSLLGKLGFEAPRPQPMPSSSVTMPDPQQPGFWSTVFGNQPYGINLSQAAPAFTFNGGSGSATAPMTAYGSGSTAWPGVPPAASNGNGSFGQQPQRQQSGQSAAGGRNSSASQHEHSTSPELANSKSASRDNDGGTAEERQKKTRKRQQTSCSECHRRKQKCNQQVPCDRCIKRGTSDACRIMLAGDNSYTEARGGEEERESPALNAEKRKRKRKNEAGEGDDLAARVQQLENIIRMTQLQQQQNGTSESAVPNGSIVGPSLAGVLNGNDLGRNEDVADSPSEAAFSVKSETSAVEEAAVAALGQLSKAKPNEGGDEARIYNGPGSVNAFLSASVFGKAVRSESRYRARPADLYLYSGVPAIHNLATPMGPRMTRLVDALAEQKAKLPPPPVCHYLWNFYYSCPLLSGRHRNFPRACIQRAYDALWERQEDRDMSDDAQAARAKNFPQLASEHSLAFLSLCFVTFAISLSLAPGSTPETAAVSSAMYEASRSALMASEQREQPTYAVIGTLFSQTMWLKLAGCPSLGFTYVAQAIRFGQSMGLHREPGPKWGLGAFEAEIRRRIWWSLAVADKGHSIAYGRPYNIFDRHCDVELPANIHEKDLTPEGPTNFRPRDEITEQTGSLISIQMSHVVAEIIDKALSCKAPSYNTILELDALLTKTESECIPEGFKNPSLSDLAEKPYLRGAYTEVQIQLCWLRSILHRPYLLQKLPKAGEPDHYAGSRALTIMLSQKILGMNKDQLNYTPENLKSYFGFAFNCFEPAVNLAMAIIQAPDSPTATILDQYVCEAIDMLDKMSHVNKVAVEGHESLLFIREKYLTAIEEATTPSTNGSKSASTNGPSPASLSYTSTSTGPSPRTSNPSPKQQPFAPAQPVQQAEAAPTPNTLFNQFFSNLSGPSPTPQSSDQAMDPATTDIEKLFNFDPTLYSSDPNATWLTQPIDGGLECWPLGMPRLEGETDFGDWAKMLGF